MRQKIVAEINRIAVRDGNPPGAQLFESETGIKQSEWRGVFWRSWSDAVLEAGYQPNKLKAKIPSEVILEKFIQAIRHFGRIPAQIDLKMYSREITNFPSSSAFDNHFNGKAALVDALREFILNKADYTDVLELLPAQDAEKELKKFKIDGSVYLLKSGPHYKIGRSDELEKRVKKITIAMPETVTLVHTIKTDDPSGIETYWHRRFSSQRANGEWFRLSVDDIRAFKRRNFQ